MKLTLYDTETRSKKQITPISGKTIRMYTCGPTIYNFAHIGNLRTYVAEDLLRRAIRFFGFQVEQAMNLTDIDDKTLKGAICKNIPLTEFTEPFAKAFFEDLETLNIEKVEHYPKATDFIPQMIEMIQKLLDQGYAYKSPQGNVYFSISKFPRYGRLSHLSIEGQKINASGDNIADEYEKDNLSDFVLWKAYEPDRDGKIYWESPFGKGRPGWHIECSAMATELLGETIDIHCGGVDNMFPHHDNEIAQSECCSGKTFVKHWLHVEHLLVDHKKMSKSLGNFYTLRDLLSMGYKGDEVRFLLLSTHYRTQLNFTFDSLNAARSSLERISSFIQRMKEIKQDSLNPVHFFDYLQRADSAFQKALSDDLNISEALAALFDFIRDVNALTDQGAIGECEATDVLELFEKWDEVLGVLPLHKKEEVPQEILTLLEKREEARKNKDFKTSDLLRDEMIQKGYIIEDTPKGARVKKKS